MKNITTDDFRFGTLVWGVVVTLLLGSVIWGFIIANNNDHAFDTTCIQQGKSITFVTLQGQDYAKKECK